MPIVISFLIVNIFFYLYNAATAVIIGFIIAGTKKRGVRIAAIVTAAAYAISLTVAYIPTLRDIVILNLGRSYVYSISAIVLCIMCIISKEKGFNGIKVIAFLGVCVISYIYSILMNSLILPGLLDNNARGIGDAYTIAPIPYILLNTASRVLGLLCAIALFNNNRNTVVINMGDSEQTAEIVVDEPAA